MWILCAAAHEVLHLLHNKARFYSTVNLTIAAPTDFRMVENIDQFDVAYAALPKRYGKLCIKPSVFVYGLGFSVLDEERNNAQFDVGVARRIVEDGCPAVFKMENSMC